MRDGISRTWSFYSFLREFQNLEEIFEIVHSFLQISLNEIRKEREILYRGMRKRKGDKNGIEKEKASETEIH